MLPSSLRPPSLNRALVLIVGVICGKCSQFIKKTKVIPTPRGTFYCSRPFVVLQGRTCDQTRNNLTSSCVPSGTRRRDCGRCGHGAISPGPQRPLLTPANSSRLHLLTKSLCETTRFSTDFVKHVLNIDSPACFTYLCKCLLEV